MLGMPPVPGKVLCYFVHDVASGTVTCVEHAKTFVSGDEARLHKEAMLRRWHRRHPIVMLLRKVSAWRNSRS